MRIAAASTTEGSPSGLVYGPASPLEPLLRTARRIAASDATVLITGETGTGKEVIARYVHAHSKRAGRPMVPVNCGAIPEALLESELFGHVRGAFTGATGARKGRIALAEGGTLFLDEIGELPLALQVKLLRVIQERTYEPVGSAESVAADFRLVAATNRNLAAEVEAGRFRRDLYFRLMVVPIEVPPLRERPQDVVSLFLHFWEQRGETRPVDPALLARLQTYPWPGNVREVENLAERLSVCVEGPTVELADLPARFRDGGAVPIPPRFALPEPPADWIPAANADVPRGPAGLPEAGEPGADPRPHHPGAEGAAAARPDVPSAAPVPPVAALPEAPARVPPAAALPVVPLPAPVRPVAALPEAPAPVPPAAGLPEAPTPVPLPPAGVLPEAPTPAPLPPAVALPHAPVPVPPAAALPEAPPAPPTPAAAPAPVVPLAPSAGDRAPDPEHGPHGPFPQVRLPPPGHPLDLPALLRRLENLYIDCALARTRGNRKAAAESLGLQRTTLVEKLRRRSRAALPADR